MYVLLTFKDHTKNEVKFLVFYFTDYISRIYILQNLICMKSFLQKVSPKSSISTLLSLLLLLLSPLQPCSPVPLFSFLLPVELLHCTTKFLFFFKVSSRISVPVSVMSLFLPFSSTFLSSPSYDLLSASSLSFHHFIFFRPFQNTQADEKRGTGCS